MNNLAKATVGLASIGTVCAGGYFIWNQYSPDYNAKATNLDRPQKWHSLNNSSSEYEAGTMGNTYGRRLLDPFDGQNRKKWEELHKIIVADEEKVGNKAITSGSFNAISVPNAFSEKDNNRITSLNKICKSHYEKRIGSDEEQEHSKIKIGDDNWKAIWMLCSM